MNVRQRILAATVGIAASLLCATAPRSASAQTGEELFQPCSACHTIGQGVRVGPDLEGVGDRRSEEWLISFIKSSQSMVSSGDPTARQLLDQFNGIAMPDFPLSDDQVRQVLAYIAGGGGGAAAAPAGPTRAATPEDIEQGRQMFQGTVRFQNGGPACNSCHDVQSADVIGGGVLAKELTTVFSRMGGTGVGAILGSAPFPVMQRAFDGKELTEDEIFALVAFLQDADARHELQQPKDYGQLLMVYGAGGFAGLLVIYVVAFGARRKRRTVNQEIYDRQVRSS